MFQLFCSIWLNFMGCKYESNAQELQLAESNFHVAWHGHGMGMPCRNWIQQFLNTFVCHNSWTYIHSRLEFVYDQEYHYCTPKNLYFYFTFCCWMPNNLYLQCKYSHEYNDLVFHIFADRFMPDSHGAEWEHNMCESLVLFIRTNYEEVNRKVWL